MLENLKSIAREWSILGVSACIIAILFYVASHQNPSSPEPATQTSQENAAPKAQTAAQQQPPPNASKAAPAASPNAAPQQPQPPAQTPAPEQAQSSPAKPAQPPGPPSGAAEHASAPSQPATAAPLPAAGNVAAGQQVYKKCRACHSIVPGKNMVGPSLAGVLGRKAGTEAGYNYSPAMKQANIVWDAKSLDSYLADPQKVVPGNKMPFPGLKSEHDRDDVIAYLISLSGGAAGSAQPQSASAAQSAAQPAPAGPASPQAAAPNPPPPQASASNAAAPSVTYIPDARYTLRSGIAEGRMVYIGVGGAIDGKINPLLTAAEGQVVQLTLINGEGAAHDIVFPDQDARSTRVTGKGASTTLAFVARKSGDFVYFCSVPGHRLAGMEGQFIVTPKPPTPTVVEADISRAPNDLPPPIGKREPQTVRVDLLSVELEGRLAEGTTFGYWTFNGKVPGPFIRVRVGDTIDIHLKNAEGSTMIHSVDFHAAPGPGGGAAALQVDPGQEKSMTWKALVPGLYVYHCATPMVAEHIASGMYGLILVEPEGGLPPVDHEFYVMQGEIYTDKAFGQHGSQEFSVEKLLGENPEYFVFNGSVGAISKLHPLHAKVGDTVRIFFGVGGPNFTSSFHVIGEIFDKVYMLGGLESPPLQGIQTVTVPPGGAVITEFKLDVPGNYTLVDHALARAERGLVGILSVEGPTNADIYNGTVMPGMGH
jgi:nitrite reductase (NO-forming)